MTEHELEELPPELARQLRNYKRSKTIELEKLMPVGVPFTKNELIINYWKKHNTVITRHAVTKIMLMMKKEGTLRPLTGHRYERIIKDAT